MIIIAEEEEEEEISTFKDERVERGRLFHRRPRDGNALSDAENCVSRRRGWKCQVSYQFNGWKSPKFLTSHESQRVRKDMKVQFPTRHIRRQCSMNIFVYFFSLLLRVFLFLLGHGKRGNCPVNSLLPGYISFLLAWEERGSLFKTRPVRSCFQSKNSSLLQIRKTGSSFNEYFSQKSTLFGEKEYARKIFALRKIWFRSGIDYYEIYQRTFSPEWIRYPDCGREIARNFQLFSHLCVTIYFIVCSSKQDSSNGVTMRMNRI